MSDDGVGVHAVRALREDPSLDAFALEVGTAVLDALPLIESAEVVIALDAVNGDQPPGTIYRFELSEPALVQRDGTPRNRSLHELDLPAALLLIPASVRPRVVVLGVEPASIAPGVELSATVCSVLPRLIAAVRSLLVELGSGPGAARVNMTTRERRARRVEDCGGEAVSCGVW